VLATISFAAAEFADDDLLVADPADDPGDDADALDQWGADGRLALATVLEMAYMGSIGSRGRARSSWPALAVKPLHIEVLVGVADAPHDGAIHRQSSITSDPARRST